MKVYKVQDMQTGLFSTGGYRPNWTKNGKIFSRLSTVKSHLRIMRGDKTFLVVVEYDLVKSSEFPVGALQS